MNPASQRPATDPTVQLSASLKVMTLAHPHATT